MDKPPTVVGVAWYQTREDWERVRALAADPEEMDETYNDWLSAAKDAVLRLWREGMTVERVAVDPDALLAWCKRNRRKINAAARSEFAASVLSERDKARHGKQPPALDR